MIIIIEYMFHIKQLRVNLQAVTLVVPITLKKRHPLSGDPPGPSEHDRFIR